MMDTKDEFTDYDYSNFVAREQQYPLVQFQHSLLSLV